MSGTNPTTATKHVSKGGKGLAAMRTAKRHRKHSDDPTRGITKPSMMRMAHRAGALRVANIFPSLRKLTVAALFSLMTDARAYADNEGRTTLTASDAKRAAKNQGMIIYGF